MNKRFENFIITLILLNGITLSLTDYGNVDIEGVPTSDGSWRNTVVEMTEIPFTFFFFIECVMKILGKGFITDEKAYLRDSWNVLDFMVVTSR